MNAFLRSLLLMALACAWAGIPPASLAAGPPDTINLQGSLATAAGSPVSGTHVYQLRFYSTAVGGSSLQTCTGTLVSATSGRYSIAVAPSPEVIATATVYYDLAVDTNDDGLDEGDLFPVRVPVHSVPFALLARDSRRLGDAPAEAYATDGELAAGLTGRAPLAHAHDGAYWSLSGNVASPTQFLGTQNDAPLELRVSGMAALRLIPHASGANLVAGHPDNEIEAGVFGGVIAGGGSSGEANRVSAPLATVGGGSVNVASATYATVGGGQLNSASGEHSTVAGGFGNRAVGSTNIIAGGMGNLADSPILSATYLVPGGTVETFYFGTAAFIGGGWGNWAHGPFSVVDGGSWSSAVGDHSAVGGGENNSSDGQHSVVAGGRNNVAFGRYSAVGGGGGEEQLGQSGTAGNRAEGDWSLVASGKSNRATAEYSAVVGGNENVAGGPNCVVCGGSQNLAGGWTSFVGAGRGNETSGESSVVAGGNQNVASGYQGFVGGGQENVASGDQSFVGGGLQNRASYRASIGGGVDNQATGSHSAIAGGRHNSADLDAVVAGGSANSASGEGSAVGGGRDNRALGLHSTVPGGRDNVASGEYSFAAGHGARANNDGAFVWSDNGPGEFADTGANTFNVRAAHGMAVESESADYAARVANHSNGDGVRAFANSSRGNNWAAVYAHNTGSSPGLYAFSTGGPAAYLEGNVTVTGTLTKGGGSFKIDHPLDPANKYLSHSFVESPDMMNVYNGNVVLDASGEATVQLPDWFGALNRDYRYQLTCIGGFAPVYIADKVKDNRFRIAGGTPGLEVSWQVTGIRQDAYANAHRICVEADKPPDERGKYLHPAEFGQPASMGVTPQAPTLAQAQPVGKGE